jgi:cell division septal protein FtsQ
VIIAALAGFVFGMRHFFITSDVFCVRSVTVDPALSFIIKKDYGRFIGRNIFTIDLLREQRRMSYKYPQTDGLKIVRQFPDSIHLVAKQRMPFAQILMNKNVFTIDDVGVVLSTTSKSNEKFPAILGLGVAPGNIALGKVVDSEGLKTALEIIKSFKNTKTLSLNRIKSINIDNTSKIDMMLDDDLNIILGGDEIDYKISVLNILISQHKLSSKDTKYIDLRFKEPVIGKKIEDEKKKNSGKKK